MANVITYYIPENFLAAMILQWCSCAAFARKDIPLIGFPKILISTIVIMFVLVTTIVK